MHLRARGLGSRFDIEEEIADVFEVDDGKISKLRLYVHRDTALPQHSRRLPAALPYDGGSSMDPSSEREVDQ